MKIKHLILAFGGASLLAACNLDEYPYGFYSEDNFYKTEADAESAVNYIYDAINYIEYSRSIVFLGDMNTDDMEPKGDAAAANKELDGWKINNFKTNTTLGNFYKYSYITINRANAVIKKVPGMNIDEGRRNRFLGEAYFMRAYSYFNLARNFGCVPVHIYSAAFWHPRRRWQGRWAVYPCRTRNAITPVPSTAQVRFSLISFAS